MNVVIGAEAVLFPEKEYISGIFVAVSCVYQRAFTVFGRDETAVCSKHQTLLRDVFLFA